GTVLRIPQNSNPFPDNRSLRNHPVVYTVVSSNETIYSIACLFGDVDPIAIAQTNGIFIDSNLVIQQELKIP
ncbi:MAG: hypothetical protein ACM3XO_08145, partial [Bacteroidota bacterium]